MTVDVISFDMPAPDDLSALAEGLDRLGSSGIRRLALFVRVAARKAIYHLLAARDLADRAEFVTVIGAEGASTPCGYAFVDHGEAASASGKPRLAIGLARVAPGDEAKLGSMEFALSVCEAVRQGLSDGAMEPDEVATVIVNVPQASSGNAVTRARRARAAAALGAGVAIGEIARADLTEDNVVANAALFTTRVQTCTGPAIRNVEIIVIGNCAGAGGDLMACNTVTTDLLDAAPLRRLLLDAGLELDPDGQLLGLERVAAVLVKAGVAADGTVAGAPTTIFSSATPPEKHVRAALSGAMGVTLKSTRLFSTFDPVQQAPVGGATICCVIRGAA
jgi:cyanuric acid amidohydrolase